jgi:hypothetical protein
MRRSDAAAHLQSDGICVSTSTYFRIAQKKIAKGEIMKGRGTRPLAANEPLVEEILEGRRVRECCRSDWPDRAPRP